jgi:flagellar protein FliO/FliZ
MKRRSGRWLGTAIAVLVVAALAVYVLTAGADHAPTAGSPPLPETQAPGPNRAPSAEARGQPAGAAIVGVGDLVGLVLKTGIVVALLGASLWALRRYAGTVPARRGTGAITVAETLPLAQGRAVYVLDVGDRALLVGATPQQLTLLGEVRDAVVLARLRAAPSHPAPSLTGLVQRLRAVLAAARGAARPAGTPHAWFDSPLSPRASDFAATLARLEGTPPTASEPGPGERLATFAARVRAPRVPR